MWLTIPGAETWTLTRIPGATSNELVETLGDADHLMTVAVKRTAEDDAGQPDDAGSRVRRPVTAMNEELVIELVTIRRPPTAPTVNTLTTSDTTPTISGTFDETDGTVTQVVVNGVTYLSSGSDLTVDNVAGTWTLTIPGAETLGDGTYEVAVTAEDALGNPTVDATSNELVIDTTGPTAPT